MKKKMKIMSEHKHAVMATIFAIFGFALLYVGATVSSFFFLAWIGVWLIIGVLVWEIREWQKRMKKEGKEIIL